MDPHTSRWQSADPAGFDLANPMKKNNKGELVAKENFSIIESTNWYTYCSNNPVKYVDPSGMEAGKPYETEEKAIEAWVKEAKQKADETDHEYASTIYKKDGKYYYSEPKEGRNRFSKPSRIPKEERKAGAEKVAEIHIHPSLRRYDQIPSGEDVKIARRESKKGYNNYVITPGGELAQDAAGGGIEFRDNGTILWKYNPERDKYDAKVFY